MSMLFIIQLIASFFLGGAAVALQTFVAEKVPKSISGIILSLPSTIVVNLFFLSRVLSIEDFKKLLPVLPAPLGFSFVIIAVYIYVQRRIKDNSLNKLKAVIGTAIFATVVWALCSAPFAIFEMTNLWISLAIYALCITITQIFFYKLDPKDVQLEEKPVSMQEKIFRSVLAGSMVGIAVFLAKILGPFWGGLMTMFPAAYLAGLIIFHHRYYCPKMSLKLFKTSPIGSTSLIVYAFAADYLLPAFGSYVGTFLALCVSSIFALILSKVVK